MALPHLFIVIYIAGHMAGYIGPVASSQAECDSRVAMLRAQIEQATATLGEKHYTLRLLCESRLKPPEVP